MRSNDMTSPIQHIRSITAFSIAELEKVDGAWPRAIFIATVADVTVIAAGDTVARQMDGLAAGIWHPVSVKAVTALSAGTEVLLGY